MKHPCTGIIQGNKTGRKVIIIRIHLKGPSGNKQGLGAWIEIYYGSGKKQVWENNPYRGYLSTMEDTGHFGLGTIKSVDSVVVRWQNGRKQKLFKI